MKQVEEWCICIHINSSTKQYLCCYGYIMCSKDLNYGCTLTSFGEWFTFQNERIETGWLERIQMGLFICPYDYKDCKKLIFC